MTSTNNITQNKRLNSQSPQSDDPHIDGEELGWTVGQADQLLEDINREIAELNTLIDMVVRTTPEPDSTTSQRPGEPRQPDIEEDLPPSNTNGNRPNTRTLAGNKARPNYKKTKAHLNIFTFNMNGGGSTHTERKWNHINQITRDKRLGIGAIQETHLTRERLTQLETKFARLKLINSADEERPNAKGVVICLNRQLVRAAEAKSLDIIPGRALLVSVPWKQNNEELRILGIYAPNNQTEQIEFWDELNTKLEALGDNEKPQIMLGDFNVVEHEIDRLPPHKDRQTVVEKVQLVRDNLTLVDQWRYEFPTTREYTYKQALSRPGDKPSQSRIDRIYVSHAMKDMCYEWKCEHSGIESDHKLVSMKIEIPAMPHIGTGCWYLPDFLLKDREAITEFKKIGSAALGKLRATKANNSSERATDIHRDFKKDIEFTARRMAKTKIPKIRATIDRKRSELRALLNNTRPDNTNLSQPDSDELLQQAGILEKELMELNCLNHQTRRDMIAAKFGKEAETISKTWIAANKTKTPRDTMYRLKVPNSSPAEYVTKSQDMANLSAEYHDGLQNLNVEKNEPGELRQRTIDETLRVLKPKLNAEERDKLATLLTRRDIERAIKDLPNGKSPGTDGLPRELYATLLEEYNRDSSREEEIPDATETTQNQEMGEAHNGETSNKQTTFDIIEYLQIIFEEIQTTGTGPDSGFSEGWMCPIYKKNDKTEVSNYRPITVLNTDYKIMTRALTTNLSEVVGNLIHKDQAGFMKGRRITDHTDLVHLLTHLCEAREEEGAIFCLDQEKAYDKIRHDFLWESLKKFDIPTEFINTVKHLYENAETKVIINGVMSKSFKIKRGVRQGDPLSCLLFNIAIESLAESLRSSTLKGITLNECRRIIASLFADDTTVYLSKDDSIDTLYELLEKWCMASGAKFNVAKTEVIPLGSREQRERMITSRKLSGDTHTIDQSIHIAKDGEAVRVLGAWVGHEINNEQIWDKVIDEINAILCKWEKGHPTQEGRRLIINMFVGGKTQYLTRVQGMPKNVEERIERIIRKFMWGLDSTSLAPPVSLSVLQQNNEQGGRKVLDIKLRNKAIELKKLQSYIRKDNDRAVGADALDEVLQRCKTDSDTNRDPSTRLDYFLQEWKVARRGKKKTPEFFQRTLDAAKEANLEIIAPEIAMSTKCERPIWYHPGLKKGARLPTEGKTAKDCLRAKHKIKSVGDMLQLAQLKPTQRHKDKDTCTCETCTSIKVKYKCDTPNKCRKLAISWIDNLNEKWNPLVENDADVEHPTVTVVNITEEQLRAKQPPPTIFNRSTLIRRVEEGFRILGRTRDKGDIIDKAKRHLPAPGEESQAANVQIKCHITQENQHMPTVVTATWFGEDDPRNKKYSIKCKYATVRDGELVAISQIATEHPTGDLTICTPTNEMAVFLNNTIRKMEEVGFTRTTYKHLYQNTLAALRERRGTTILSPGKCIQAGELLENNTVDAITVDITKQDEKTSAFLLEGARFINLSQSEIYNGLRVHNEEKKRSKKTRTRKSKNSSHPDNLTNPPPDVEIQEEQERQQERANNNAVEREVNTHTVTNKADTDESGDIRRPATMRNLDLARTAIRNQHDIEVTDRQLWRSLRNKDISLKIRAFLWLAMHNGQRVGDFWKKISGYEDRSRCSICDELETMTHILTECKASGQETLWKLAETTLENRNIDAAQKPSIGDVLGCGLKEPGIKSMEEKGRERLKSIIISETAHLIWRTRCEWKIGRDADRN